MSQSGAAVPSDQAVVGDQWPPQPEPRTQRTGAQSRPRPTSTAGPPAASHGGAGIPGRRTVTIRGVGAEAWAARPSSRSSRPAPSRSSPAPSGLSRPAPSRSSRRAPSRSSRSSSAARRRPRAYERAGFRPDRVAMWAVLLGVVLVLVAATSSHAAQTPAAAHRPAAPALTAAHSRSLPTALLSSAGQVRPPHR